MTNIEKVKRILDAGHWAKVTYDDGVTRIITSYYDGKFGQCILSYVRTDMDIMVVLDTPDFKDCTIEVIQRIPTPYVAGDKVLVLSDISLSCDDSEGGTDAAEYIDEMVWKVSIIKANNGVHYSVYNYDKSDFYYFPAYCLAPSFDEDSLSGKEAKVTIDGKEYTATLKLI